ncbi:MAG: hypothetical protein ACTHLZ_07495 [Tepidisphaeraceae bacterium]
MLKSNLVAAAVMAGVLGLAGAARAGGFSIDVNVGYPPPARVWVEPVYETRTERVWVEPVTQMQTQNVWHEAVTEDRVDQQWVPDRFEVRDVETRTRSGRRVIERQSVLVEAAHWQTVHTPVVVRAGYWGPEAVPVVVTPGYWQTVPQRVCVQEGHWAEAPLCERPVIVVPDRGPRFDRDHDRDDGGRFDRGRWDHGRSDHDRYDHDDRDSWHHR